MESSNRNKQMESLWNTLAPHSSILSFLMLLKMFQAQGEQCPVVLLARNHLAEEELLQLKWSVILQL